MLSRMLGVIAVLAMVPLANTAPTGAVLGIDFGSDNCVVAIARRKGVDIVSNEASQRSTPSIVSFGAQQRFLGEAGATQRMTNMKNTATELKAMVGKMFKDPMFLENVKRTAPFETKEAKNGDILVKSSLYGKERLFTPTQLVAMLLTNLKKIAALDHGSEVLDCVIGVPIHFNEKQRNCISNAAEIAGLKCLRLINENTATALGYGLFALSVHPHLCAPSWATPRVGVLRTPLHVPSPTSKQALLLLLCTSARRYKFPCHPWEWEAHYTV